jgi:branched-chain amino acid transport system substrate-binding protein
MKNRIPVALCVAASLTATLSACGDDAAGSSDGDITLMVIESMTGAAGVDQTSPKGAEAAAAALNAAGGIDGRDVKIVTCDTASDPNKSAECARKAVTDNVTAVVGGFDPLGVGASLPILEAGQIPYVAPIGTMPIEFTSSNTFTVTGGSGAGSFGTVAAAENHGCKSVAVWGDLSADSGQTEALGGALESRGMDVSVVDLPTSTTDVTPMVSQALEDDPDCAIYIAGGQMAVQLVGGLHKAGSDAQFITAQAVLLPPFLKALGGSADGIIATTDTPDLASGELKPFFDDMKAHQPDVQISPFTLAGWYGVQVVKDVAEGLDEVSAASLLDALGSTSDLQLPGLPELDFTSTHDSKLYPRMFNANVQYTVVKNGAYASTDGEWHTIADVLP